MAETDLTTLPDPSLRQRVKHGALVAIVAVGIAFDAGWPWYGAVLAGLLLAALLSPFTPSRGPRPRTAKPHKGE